jgi:hypothetical protein
MEGLQMLAYVTNSMELSPSWEAVRLSTTQVGPILSQINPVHTTLFYLSKIHFILLHDVCKPEVLSQKSTTETSVARQRLDKHFSHSNELPWQRIRRMTEEL